MDIDKAKEFKHLLFEGPVKFTFTKKDGTLREALGTLKNDLLPKTEKTVTYLCTDISWDVDLDDEENEEVLSLPKAVRIKNVPTNFSGPDELEEFLADQLSNSFKFAVNNFKYEEQQKKSMPADSVLFYDLERGGYRSCKIDSIVSFEAKA